MNDPKITVKQKILDSFRELKIGAGEFLSRSAMDQQLLPALSDSERDALQETLEEMAVDGLLKPTDRDGDGWLLTESGEDQVFHIYA